MVLKSIQKSIYLYKKPNIYTFAKPRRASELGQPRVRYVDDINGERHGPWYSARSSYIQTRTFQSASDRKGHLGSLVHAGVHGPADRTDVHPRFRHDPRALPERIHDSPTCVRPLVHRFHGLDHAVLLADVLRILRLKGSSVMQCINHRRVFLLLYTYLLELAGNQAQSTNHKTHRESGIFMPNRAQSFNYADSIRNWVSSLGVRVWLIVGVGIVVFVAFYLLLLPGMLASSYANSVEDNQKKLEEQLVQLYKFYKHPVYQKDPYTRLPESDSTDHAVRQAQKDHKLFDRLQAQADSRLASSKRRLEATDKSLTGFISLPFLAWNDSYDSAKKLHKVEESYVKDLRAFIKEGKEDNEFDKETQFSDDLYIKALKALAEAENSDDPEVLADGADKFASRYHIYIQAEKAELKKCPCTAKERNYMKQLIKLDEEVRDIFRLTARYIKAENYDGILGLEGRFNKASDHGEKIIVKWFKEEREDLNKKIKSLRETEEEIENLYLSV